MGPAAGFPGGCRRFFYSRPVYLLSDRRGPSFFGADQLFASFHQRKDRFCSIEVHSVFENHVPPARRVLWPTAFFVLRPVYPRLAVYLFPEHQARLKYARQSARGWGL